MATTSRVAFTSTVVEYGAVEVAVSSLRAFVEDVATVSAICASLATMATREDGALAIASRGGTRQLSRMLQDVATSSGSAVHWQAALHTVLRDVLLVVDRVADSKESADILNKQGIVHNVVAVLDSGVGGLKEGGGSSSSGGGSGGAGGAGADAGSGAGAAGAAAGGDGDGGAGGEVAGGVGVAASNEHSEQIRKLITSILSKLLNMADVAESVRAVQETVERMAAAAGTASAEGAGTVGGSLSRAALDVGMAGLKKLFSLCETAVGQNAGHKAWVGAAR